jgi:hypothetical protein
VFGGRYVYTLNNTRAGVAAAAFEVFANDYAWDTLGITVTRQSDWIPDLITYDVFTDDIDPRNSLIIGKSRYLSIRFHTLPSGRVEMSVEEHKRYEHNELIPRQLQTLVQNFPEKFKNYFQELASEPAEQGAARGKIRHHIERLVEIYQNNLHNLEVRAARQSMDVDIKTLNEIEYTEGRIAQLKEKLKSLRET